MNLYPADALEFITQGFGSLDADVLDSYATVEVNGVNEAEITYAAQGRRFQELETGRIITLENADGGDPQPYRIYKISKPLNGRVRISCQHLGYDVLGYPVAPFKATGIAAALAGIEQHCLVPNHFALVPVTVSNTDSIYDQKKVKSMMDCLKGTEGSVLDVFHGSGLEFALDGWNIKAYSALGSDKGVKIRYGKNMTDLKAVEDSTAFYTGCVAFWEDSETHECLYGDIAYCSNSQSIPVQKVFVLDASADYEEQPTVEQLTSRAGQYVTANDFGVPKVTIDVSFVNLADSPEFEYLKNLQRVKLGDIVTVEHEEYGISYKAEVIKTVWDNVRKRYKSITIGTKKGTVAGSIKNSVVQALQPQVDQIESSLDRAINQGTERLRGGLGGYVVINTNADGNPNEILIMDTPDITTAVHVIRLNREGIGFSNDGYDGEYRTAWLIDGTFYAENINAGVLEGELLRAGSVLTSSLNVTAKNVVEGWSENFWTDEAGLHIAKYDMENLRPVGTYQALFSDMGMRVVENSSGNAMLVAEGDSVTAENFTAHNFMIIDPGTYKARFQEYGNAEDSKQIGCFWID